MIINKLKNQEGFSLIELMAVLVILAIISSLAVPQFNKIIRTAQVDTDLNNIQTVARALEIYIASGEFQLAGQFDQNTLDFNDIGISEVPKSKYDTNSNLMINGETTTGAETRYTEIYFEYDNGKWNDEINFDVAIGSQDHTNKTGIYKGGNSKDGYTYTGVIFQTPVALVR